MECGKCIKEDEIKDIKKDIKNLQLNEVSTNGELKALAKEIKELVQTLNAFIKKQDEREKISEKRYQELEKRPLIKYEKAVWLFLGAGISGLGAYILNSILN